MTRILFWSIVDPICKVDLEEVLEFSAEICALVYSFSMKVREVIQLIESHGWRLLSQKGSHRQYKHPTIVGRVTIPGHPSDDLAPGTLNSIFKQARLK